MGYRLLSDIKNGFILKFSFYIVTGWPTCFLNGQGLDFVFAAKKLIIINPSLSDLDEMSKRALK